MYGWEVLQLSVCPDEKVEKLFREEKDLAENLRTSPTPYKYYLGRVL
jgi:hypothetical protein